MTSQRSGGRPDETEKERIDRELIELLNELRVALPGVQVLFAFLLIVPFSQGFAKLDSFQRNLYVATLLCAAVSTALLIAPSAYHRLRFRAGDKRRMLFSSNRMSIAGLAFLALAITLAVFLIVGEVVGFSAGVPLSIAIGLWFAWLWYVIPLSRRAGDAQREDDR